MISPGTHNFTETHRAIFGIEPTPPPTANFTISNTNALVDEIIRLQDSSTGRVEFRTWRAVGGNLNENAWNDAVVTVSYPEPGDYTIELLVRNERGRDSISKIVHVRRNIVYGPTISHTACGSYIWGGQTYTESGTYTHAFNPNPYTDSIVTLNLTIKPKPTAVILAEGNDVCTNSSMQLTGKSVVSRKVLTSSFTGLNGKNNVEMPTPPEFTPNALFPTCTNVFNAEDAILIGTAEFPGSIVSKELDLSSGGYISFKMKGHGITPPSKGGIVEILVDGNTANSIKITIPTNINWTDNFETYTVMLPVATSSSTVTIRSYRRRPTDVREYRFFLDDINIYSSQELANSTYAWSNGENTSSIEISNGGTYRLTVNADGCTGAVVKSLSTTTPVQPTFSFPETEFCNSKSGTILTNVSNQGITGAWYPSLKSGDFILPITSTTDFEFRPQAGQCANSTWQTITINPKELPTFDNVQTEYIIGETVSPLPTISDNGISGTWSPTICNTTTTYTFTPTSGQCANTTTLTITVDKATPRFESVETEYCHGATISPLPTRADNGYTGTWTPSINSLATTTYTFTPDDTENVKTVTLTININLPAEPEFASLDDFYCVGMGLPVLAETSDNGFLGTWSPAELSSNATTYTFTPNVGECAISFAKEISVAEVYANILGENEICSNENAIFTAECYMQTADVNATKIPVAASYAWNTGENTNTISANSADTYIVTTTAENGCTFVNNVSLTVLPVATADFYQTACVSYSWNGQTYTESGIYTHTFENLAANGCDSVETLHLTINQPVAHEFSLTACEFYTWNEQTYTQSGDYTQILENQAANGCDSVVTLHLTINPRLSSEISATSCDNYTWYGTTYTTSGSYTHTLSSLVTGCDSVVTLHLTINNSVQHEFEQIACGSFTWNEETYTVSGDYEQTFASANGCDSVVTLHLTINALPEVMIEQDGFILTATAGFSTYEWNTGETTESISIAATDTYSVTVTNSEGCENSAEIEVNELPTFVEEFTIQQIAVYPNPNNGEFTINLTNIYNAEVYQIIDMRGAIVKQAVIDTNEQFVSIKVAPGTYTLRVVTTEKHYVEKVVIQ